MSKPGALAIALAMAFSSLSCGGSRLVGGAAKTTGGGDGGSTPDGGGSSGADGGSGGADGSGAETSAGDGGLDASLDVAPPVPFTAALVVRIPLPGTPTVATYNAGTKKAYFKCLTDATTSAGIAVVDDTTNAVVANIPAPNALTILVSNSKTKKVYGVEGAQIDVIDSVTDKVTAMVSTPDSSPIDGLAVDEVNDKVYVVTTTAVVAYFYSFDGATNAFGVSHQILLHPVGTPPIAADGTAQKVFIMGADSNMQGEEVTIDATTGIPMKLTTTERMVSPSGSGIVALDGTAALVFVSPGIVKILGRDDEGLLPAAFSPTSVTVLPGAPRPTIFVAGFGADREPVGYTLDPAAPTPAAVNLALGGDVFKTTTVQQALVGAPLANGAELYLDAKPSSTSTAARGPAETVKISLTR